MHMTGRFAYEAFSEHMGCPQILDDGALFVGKEYFWESAGYYWKIYKPSTAGNDMYNLNKICDDYEDIDFSDNASVVESVTEVTHVINGGESELGRRIEAYKYFINLFL